MPLSELILDRLAAALVSGAGGYLRNPIRERNVTCEVCTTPAEGFARCFNCNAHRESGAPLADAVAALFYAIGGQQSGYIMRGYKFDPPVQEHRDVVALAGLVGIGKHTRCAVALAGKPVTHWSVVSSMPAKVGLHPLRNLVAPAATGTEVTLRAAASSTNPRALDPMHYRADPIPKDSHMLLIEDTWAGGGHAQSAALAVRAAGASHVSILTVGRFLNLEFRANRPFERDRLTRDYDPLLCPWTGAGCP